ncbi:hypothetical protein [Burkholderia sp. PAMC 26561]|uniref:hypothetical protein n=1 Tax=Burkholderia sp. PAMC 26561 TaxID=1795043 RepID=UPI0013C44AA3|nr:hypothetical protein [Burkholderia sp. PAMC 26561]
MQALLSGQQRGVLAALIALIAVGRRQALTSTAPTTALREFADSLIEATVNYQMTSDVTAFARSLSTCAAAARTDPPGSPRAINAS